MKRVGWWMVLAVAGSLRLVAAQAESPDEYRIAPLRPSPPRPAFAAESAATARALEPHERDERRFLKDAAAASRFQVDAARMALAHSSNAGVRSLATTVSSEHAAAANDLLRLLHRRGLAPPMLENTQRRALARLARLHGVKFEREYMTTVVAAARDEIALCEKAAGGVQDAALADWIAQWLPVLRAQLASAERLTAHSLAAPRTVPDRRAPHRGGGEPPGLSGWNTR